MAIFNSYVTVITRGEVQKFLGLPQDFGVEQCERTYARTKQGASGEVTGDVPLEPQITINHHH